MGKRNFKFVNHTAKLKDWKYMEMFIFTPSIGTESFNSYVDKKPYAYTRCVFFQWLGIMVGIEWDYGKTEEERKGI